VIVQRPLQTVWLSVVIWGCAAVGTQAGWGGFYTKSQTAVLTETDLSSPVQSVCIREILLAQNRYGIPDNILLGIGLQEAGTKIDKQLMVWPWTINAEGQGYLFETKAAAMTRVANQLNSGMRSIDIGCMQINLRWHPDAFSSLIEGFDPKTNVNYAAHLLKTLYNKTGSWRIAAGRYHSKTLSRQKIYLKSLQPNIRVANAQIDQFRLLAGLNSPITRTTELSQEHPTKPAANKPRKNSFWTAALSLQGASADRYRSIYSQAQLQPILPQFKNNALRRLR